ASSTCRGFCAEAALSRKTSGLPCISRSRMGKSTRGARASMVLPPPTGVVSVRSIVRAIWPPSPRFSRHPLDAPTLGHTRCPYTETVGGSGVASLHLPPPTSSAFSAKVRLLALVALAGEPLVALLLQLQRELRATALDNAPAVHHVDDIRRDVVKDTLVVRDDKHA